MCLLYLNLTFLALRLYSENSYYFHVSELDPNSRQSYIHLIEFKVNHLLENGGLDIAVFKLENTNM